MQACLLIFFGISAPSLTWHLALVLLFLPPWRAPDPSVTLAEQLLHHIFSSFHSFFFLRGSFIYLLNGVAA